MPFTYSKLTPLPHGTTAPIRPGPAHYQGFTITQQGDYQF
jgi:hypothetical protein